MSVIHKTTHARVWVCCPQTLHNNLATIERTGDNILAKNLRGPLGYDAAEIKFRSIRDMIKTDKRLAMHGWRYTAALELVKAGCSEVKYRRLRATKRWE